MADDVIPLKPRPPAKPPVQPAIIAVEPDELGSEEHRLRLLGHTWSSIAKQLGHKSPLAAQMTRQRYLQRAALALSREQKLEALQLEVERLDTLQVSYWDAAIAGDVKAAEVVLKIIGQRCKLLGLDDPEQGTQSMRTIVVTGDSNQYVTTLKKLIAGQASEPVDAELIE